MNGGNVFIMWMAANETVDGEPIRLKAEFGLKSDFSFESIKISRWMHSVRVHVSHAFPEAGDGVGNAGNY